MSDPRNPGEVEDASGMPPPAGDQTPAESIRVYATAGIGERQGHVPIWLWIVVLALFTWGIFYLYTYWNPPGPTT